MATFISKKRESRFVIRPIDRMIDENRRVSIIRGKTAEFYNYTLNTEDPEIINFLRNNNSNGKDYNEIVEGSGEEIKAGKDWIKARGIKPMVIPKMATGAASTQTAAAQLMVPGPEAEVEVTTRPTDIVSASPELLRAIGEIVDSKINSSLAQIMDLLKKDEKKEEKVKEQPKVKRTFTCPYCGDIFYTPFTVGSHKKTCDKKPLKE